MKTIAYTMFVILLTGCTTGKSVGNIKNEIAEEKNKIAAINRKIDSLDERRITKAATGELDEITDSITHVYILRLKDSINARLGFFNALVSNRKIRKNRNEVQAYLNVVEKQYGKELDNIVFLDDLFKASTFNRLNTAAFFAPGEYMLTDTARAQSSVIMEDIIKQAAVFSNSHTNRKLKAMFVVLGYADEQEIAKGSALYNDLTTAIGVKSGDRNRLNTELSNRRAASIKNILREKYRLYFPDREGSLFTSSFIATGKGELLPPGHVDNYQPIDERRRVVLLYWSILPDLE